MRRTNLCCLSSTNACKMLSPLLSWILPSSSSSSTSSDGEENVDTDDGDYGNHSQPEDTPSTSFAGGNLPIAIAVPNASPSVTVAFPGVEERSIPKPDTLPNTMTPQKRQRISYSGRQCQRLWTKQDEIELLKGYLDYIRQHRWAGNSLQNDVTFFYDHIRPKLKMGFNKNQLVEKLRRLKRKHKNASDKLSGKEVSFKNPQEQAIFEISHKIWGKNRHQDAWDDNDESRPNSETRNIGNIKVKTEEVDRDEMEDGLLRPQKRSRLITDGSRLLNDGSASHEQNNGNTSSIQGIIEETMRSCLPPLLKELFNDALEGSINAAALGGLALNMVPLSSGEQSTMDSGRVEVGDEKSRKQRILELEAYLKRLELQQDQIKARLEELRSSRE